MVENQLRASRITDRRLLAIISAIPRELFVGEAMRPLAYMEGPVRAGGNRQHPRFLPAPCSLATLIQAAQPPESALILDIGCATGYSTAILARLAAAGAVVGLDSDPGLVQTAARLLSRLQIENAAFLCAPLAGGYPEQGPYDLILINGQIPARPDQLFRQIKPGGRLAAILPPGRAWIFTKSGETIAGRIIAAAAAPPLPGFPHPALRFAFPGLNQTDGLAPDA